MLIGNNQVISRVMVKITVFFLGLFIKNYDYFMCKLNRPMTTVKNV